MSATTPPTYYAVIFSSRRTEIADGYTAMAEAMEELAREQPGFLGLESVRDSNGHGITVSYWTNREAIRHWSQHLAHLAAQDKGRTHWYRDYSIRICVVEEARSWSSDNELQTGG